MYKRNISQFVQNLVNDGDSVLLLGPRQVGKTTLVHSLFTDCLKYDLSRPDERLRLARDPAKLIDEVQAKLGDGGIFAVDEVQKVPALFDAIQHLLDNKRDGYRAVLTGSSARQLRKGAVNTLPGRVIQLRMLPLTADELGYYSEKNPKKRADMLGSMMTFGLLPGIQQMNEKRAARHLRSYVQTYLEQEILGDALTKDIGTFYRFLNIVAARSGQILNLSNLSQESGVAINTVKHHVGVLIDTMTAYSVPGFSFNDTSTWLSTPRLLLFDIGVRNAAAERVLDFRAIAPEYGLLFENWVGLELLGMMANHEPPMHLAYWRTTTQKEVDWIVRSGSSIMAIEVKWNENWKPSDLKHLSALRGELRQRKPSLKITTGLICRTPRMATHDGHKIIPPYLLKDFFDEWIN